MRLHTIQDLPFWEHAQRRGMLTTIDEQFVCPEFRDAYAWMRRQMSLRLPNCSGDFPIWAWVKRPDLRRWTTTPHRQQMVLLTVEVPPERVLVSDFEGWHFVLNGWYLPVTEEDMDARERVPPTREEIERSWERIFLPRHPDDVALSGELQACIDSVYLHEVVTVRRFTSR